MEQQTANSDATSAASSPAPVSAQSVIDSLSSEERTSWEMTGDFPERVQVKTGDTPLDEKAADTSSAQPADQATATAVDAPASEPGTPAKKEKGAKARTAELDAEIAEMRERLRIRAALREELDRATPPKTPTPDSSPAAETPSEYERYLAMPDAPKEEDFDSYAKFTAAMGVFITDQRWQEHQQRASAESTHMRTVDGLRQVSEAAQTRVTEFAKGDPAFAEKVNPQLLQIEPATMRRLKGEPIGPQHVLAEELAKSEAVGPLLLHFSTPEGQAEWGQLVRLPPTDLLRAFGRIEARFDSASPSAPAPKYVSSAATPPTVLGQRPADTSDPVDAAIKRKDPEAYAREQNKRELAAMGL